MSTSLFVLTNSKLTGRETKADYDRILDELKSLTLDKSSHINAKGETVEENGDWEYEIDDIACIPYRVCYSGPFMCFPDLQRNAGVIYTIYKYRLIYETQTLDWFENFRQGLFEIVKIMGGTEIIYVADNSCDKLAHYLECMAWEDIPYEQIKAKMIAELGNPVTKYSDLDYDRLTYANITEFFLDDFKDLKSNDESNTMD